MAEYHSANVGASSYDLDTALRRDIENVVTLLSPHDAPLTGTYNRSRTPGPVLPRGGATHTKVEWLETELITPRSSLNGAYTSGGGTLTVASGEAERFRVDDILKVNDVVYRVTAVNTGTDELTVSTWTGSDANAADGDVVMVIGTAPAEGADPGAARTTDRVVNYNLTQIFGPEPIEMTETELVVGRGGKFGVENEWDYQLANRVKEMWVKLEQALVYSKRVDDSGNRRRSMGGIDYWISTNEDSSTTTITESAIRSLQQDCYDNGGEPNTLLLSPSQKIKVSDFSSGVTLNRDADSRLRGQIVDFIENDFGRLYVIMNRWLSTSDGFLFNPLQTEIATLRPLVFEMLAKTGDRKQGMIVAEKTLKFRAEKWAGKFTGLTV